MTYLIQIRPVFLEVFRHATVAVTALLAEINWGLVAIMINLLMGVPYIQRRIGFKRG